VLADIAFLEQEAFAANNAFGKEPRYFLPLFIA